MTDNVLHPRGAPSEWGSDPTVEAFGKNPLWTVVPLAVEASDPDLDLDSAAMGGKIGE